MQNTLNQRMRQAARPRKLEAWRLWVVMAAFVAFGLYNGRQLFSLQILQHDELAPRAESRIKWRDTLQPNRGLIYDSRGQLLAGNTTAHDLYVDKSNLMTRDAETRESVLDEKALRAITDLLGPVLRQDSNDLFTRLRDSESTSLRVASRLGDEDVQKVRDLLKRYPDDLLYRIRFEVQPKRQYPAGTVIPGSTLAASVLGFTNYENQGHYGVEEYYNAQLAGKAGWIDAEHDAEGRPLVLREPEMEPAEDGADVVLTIDSAVQYMAERELWNSIQEFKADSGFVVVQDPQTGGILALANWPTFDPNKFNTYPEYSRFKNPTVNDVIEPGSTMKILTYASSIDAGAITPDTTFQCNGVINRYGWNIWNATHTAHGQESMREGLGQSCNIASMFAAEQLGQNRFYEYVEQFGIGRRTGIDLPGEVPGLIWYPGDDNFSPVNLFTNSFGQGVATTPVQLVTAVSAVANGGMLLKPHVMREIARDGKTVETFETQEVRRVLQPETTQQIADMLAYGVENGLVARFSHVPGHHVSVKTGTAQLPDENGGYTDAGSFASAMGFAPSYDARFTLYIGLMNPKTSQWGENTASRSWGRLAKELLMYLKVQPTEPVPTVTATP